MGWQVVTSYLSYLSRKSRNVNSLSENRATEDIDEISRWRSCVEEVTKTMKFAVAALYVRQEFDVKSRLLAASMFSSVKEAFMNNLNQIDWMDYETRLASKDKVEAMQINIGTDY